MTQIADIAAERQKRQVNPTIRLIIGRINEWAAQANITIDPATGVMTQTLPASNTTIDVAEKDALDLIRYGHDIHPDEFGRTEGPFRVALRQWVMEDRDLQLKKLINTICGHNNFRITPADDWEPIRKVLTLGSHNSLSSEVLEDHICMFAQWVWCQKRMLIGELDHHQVAPFLTGTAHGTGKTEFMRRLCSPYREFYRESTFPQLFEKFGWRPLTLFRIVGIDDADKGNEKQIAIFKRTLSSRYITQRTMQKEVSAYRPRTATLIGTSNHMVRDVITDTTGARRLWELPFTNAQITASDNWDTRLGDKLLLAFYQCVNELDVVPPIYRRFKTIAATQNSTLRGWNIVRKFYEECMVPMDVPTTQTMDLMKVKKQMRMWADMGGKGQSLPSLAEIAEELQAIGVPCQYDSKRKTWSFTGFDLVNTDNV